MTPVVFCATCDRPIRDPAHSFMRQTWSENGQRFKADGPHHRKCLNFKLTPKRRQLLEHLRQRGASGFYVSAIADLISPREYGWSGQGAARWGGAFIRPLEAQGLVTVNRRVSAGVGIAHITPKGLEALK